MKNQIEIKNLSFCYSAKPILKDVNVTINKNEFIGIIGPNGGGKTTLLKLLMGFLSPHVGKIKIFGKKPQNVRNIFGYVPQSYNIDRTFPISVLDVVLLNTINKGSIFGYSKKIKEKAVSLLEKLGLKDHIHSPYGKLSGGQTQRALIARALIFDPEILILDEPTANIDIKAEQEIFDLLTNEKKRTILMVTHDLNTIISKVQKVLTVQCYVNTMLPEEVCKHFTLGLYHKPIIQGQK
jgi:zinc transport system ATP-binding protein